MAFALLPLAAILLLVGLTTQIAQIGNSVPGAGMAGQMDAVARVSAQQAEMFGTACSATASAQPGMISASLPVTLPPGVQLPKGAVCMTTAAGSGRNVFAFLPSVAGEADTVMDDMSQSSTWFSVSNRGLATNLASGQLVAVPLSIPVGSILDWVQTSS